ncbi:MAG: TonB-dependent receptor [Planctomycetia bacterium]
MDIESLTKVDAVVPAFDIEVSSVSKQESTIGKSPAAVYVITSEMIRRSGATCIPEALRMAPGVEVARVNSNAWAISIRGFNDRYSNKLLVLIDGRSVYSPILSGTFWDMIDMPLEDIERIEVIRGPGGTLWGANAVNGIINIISKKAKDTQGVLVSSGGGSQDYNISTVRYGGQIGRNMKFRVWGKYSERGPEDSPGHYDDWRNGRGGFYADWNPRGSKDDLVTFQGNFFGGEEGVRFIQSQLTPSRFVDIIGDRHVSESSLLARWTHTISDESDWTLQAYFDQTCRYGPQAGFTANTFDVDFQYRRPVGRRHKLITGVEYRRTHDFLNMPSASLQFYPTSRAYDMISGYIQDEIELVDDTFYLTAGSKFEGNSFTGFEYQPSVRALWAIDNEHVLWGAISRAVRTPNRFDEDMESYRFYADMGLFDAYTKLNGNTGILSEEVIAYELGYRAQTTKKFSWDISLFANKYRRLMGYNSGIPGMEGPIYVIPLNLANGGNGETYGFEWTANWEVNEKWTLAGSYSFLIFDKRYAMFNGQKPLPGAGNAFDDPNNQIRLQSYWNFARNWQLDCFLRYVDEIEEYDVPSYITMDLRLGWRPTKHLEFSVVGQNLFDTHHQEFYSYRQYCEPNLVEINRGVFARMTWTR